MTKGLITKAYLDDIADSIREKLDTDTEYLPAEMANAIRSIENTYTSEDEGKVVSDGALVAQTARSEQITQNGTYDTTLNNSVVVEAESTIIVKQEPVTENGTYYAESDNADGYSQFTVNVSGGGGGGGSTNILSGLSTPTPLLGSDGDIYLLYSEAFVKNSAGQFINTGYHGNSNSKYYIKFMLEEQQTGQYATPFGARSATGSVTYASYVNTSFNNNRNVTYVGWGSYQSQAFAFGDSAMVGKLVEMTLEAGQLNVSVDGVENTFTFTAPSITDTTPIGIFAMLINGSLPSFTPYMKGMKLFAFDIFESGTLVHSYRPALDANDVACVYDSIEQQYLYHSGGGTLQFGDAGTITASYLKVNGTWQDLIGSDINDVNG